MAIRTTVRVGLHTTDRGVLLSQYKCILSGMHGVETDEDVIDYLRRRLSSDRIIGGYDLLGCIDHNDYLITREVV